MSNLRAFLWMIVAAVTMWSPVVANAQSSDLPQVMYATNGGSFSNPALTSMTTPGRVLANTASGGVTVTDAVSALIGGRAVAMSLARGLSKSQVATVAARCLLNPICIGSAAGVALVATMASRRCEIRDGHFVCDAGTASTTGSVLRYCVAGTSNCSGIPDTSMYATPQLACSGSVAGHPAQYLAPTSGYPYGRCNVWQTDSGGYYRAYEVGARTVQGAVCVGGASPDPDGRCPTGVYAEPSVDQLGNNIGALPTGTVDGAGVVGDGIRSGVPVDSTTPGTLTGPTSIPGSTSTTTTGSGTTTTTNSTSISYGGNSYTYHNTTVTVNPDGTTTTTEETPTDVAPPNNPALGEIPSLYTRAYPEGMVGVWNTKRAALSSTPIANFVNSFVPQTGDGGCPTWTLPSGNLMGIAVGGNVSIPCSVWSFIRLVMVCSALLLARALIFGG